MAQIDEQGNIDEKNMLKFENGLAPTDLNGTKEFEMGE
eukprot:CAMPEP_0205815890 /NCGR_PEP_ID=MMETSP0205-20121125/21861_1 /ASSEMBLY_ACC=CAM_ASM_000278 /TAXON_ID=36767 /ORGANISM="Euplotes focardii, Strain TN1" /LENGTH=37 /DNA_ID= /DNA_START= /DNA_END= /DNA_ORIENTATION=